MLTIIFEEVDGKMQIFNLPPNHVCTLFTASIFSGKPTILFE